MTITPSGSPAWTRTAGIADYGGDVDKRNYLSLGVIDALTDVGAEAICRMSADLAAVARTAPFAVITFTMDDLTPAAPTIHSVRMMTGVNTVGYAGDAPPAGFPSAARNGNGDVTFTFAASYDDEYSVAGSYAPLDAEANVHSTSAEHATAVVSGVTVRVRVFDDAGSSSGGAKVTLVVT